MPNTLGKLQEQGRIGGWYDVQILEAVSLPRKSCLIFFFKNFISKMTYLHELHSFAYNTRLSFHGDIAVGTKIGF